MMWTPSGRARLVEHADQLLDRCAIGLVRADVLKANGGVRGDHEARRTGDVDGFEVEADVHAIGTRDFARLVEQQGEGHWVLLQEGDGVSAGHVDFGGAFLRSDEGDVFAFERTDLVHALYAVRSPSASQ